MIHSVDERAAVRSYLFAVLRSRRAVDRILASVADVAERDEQCARNIAEHPEVLAALARMTAPPGRLLRYRTTAGSTFGGRTPAKPYICIPSSPRRERARAHHPTEPRIS